MEEIAIFTFHFIGYVLSDIIFGTFFYCLGWPVVKLATLGKYPKKRRKNSREEIYVACAGMVVFAIAIMAALDQISIITMRSTPFAPLTVKKGTDLLSRANNWLPLNQKYGIAFYGSLRRRQSLAAITKQYLETHEHLSLTHFQSRPPLGRFGYRQY